MKFETVLAAWKRRKKTRITGVVSVTVDLMRTRATAKLKVRSPVVLFAGKNSSADCSSDLKRRKKTRITGVVSVTVDLMRTRATAKLKVRSPVVLFAGKNSSADCSS